MYIYFYFCQTNIDLTNPTGDDFMDYRIAKVNSQEFNAIQKAENLIKNEIGKDFVLIAYEKTPEH